MDFQERITRGFKPDYSEAYEEARRAWGSLAPMPGTPNSSRISPASASTDYMGNQNAELSTYHEEQPCALCGDSRRCPMCDTDDGPATRAPRFLNNPATEQPTPVEKIRENTVGTIIAIAPHETKENVYIILGREDGCPEPNLFTREASGLDGAQFWGHYRLTLKEAFEDYEERLGRATN